MTKDATFCWNELETRDLKAASKFYEDVLGWTSHEWDPDDPGRYVNFMAGDTMVAGMLDISDAQFDGIPNHWFAYIQVDDIAATCAKVEGAGGQVRKPPFDIPKVGKIAIISDSTEAVFGLLEPEKPA